MAIFQSLEQLGWKPFFQQQLHGSEPGTSKPARVIAVHRSEIIVHDGTSEAHIPVAWLDDDMAVGDWLLLDTSTSRPQRRLDRLSELSRKMPGSKVAKQMIAANIDTLFITTSCNADFNESRLERYLALASEADIFPIIVATKSDLAEDPEIYRQRAARLHSGLIVEVVNALDKSTLQGIRSWCGSGQTIALLGSSGVGKSTLVNALTQAGLATSGIREDDARGRHTTTSRSLHAMTDGGILVDTPGMRELQLADVEHGLEDVFAEIIAAAERCRFVDCEHQSEPGCAVQGALDAGEIDPRRWQNYRKLLREQAHNTRTLAESHEHFRKQGKLYKQIQSTHRKRKVNH